jgi:hypothetical protein
LSSDNGGVVLRRRPTNARDKAFRTPCRGNRPAVGLFLLGIGGGQNYTLMLWGAGVAVILGALVILPVKSVR